VLKLFKLVFVSCQYYVGFCDACHILEEDNVFWDSLLTFVLYVMDDSGTIAVYFCLCFFMICLSTIVTEVLFSLECAFVRFFYIDVFLPRAECCSCFADTTIKPMLVQRYCTDFD
jgi:cell division protein FtsW (lipid II flippase)